LKKQWTIWQALPTPEECRQIVAPDGPGVYQLRNRKTKELVLFGIGRECRKRMKSLFPAPYGSGKRNNFSKREYILKNWRDIDYRTWATDTREEANELEDGLKAKRNHIFNT